jgi:glycosyltransferase involved in cell wall biosynthesis
MCVKKILIVSASYYPLNSPRSFRTTELAEELVRQGHDVLVYIPFRGHNYSDYITKTGIKLKDIGSLNFRSIALKGNRIELILRRGIRRLLGLMLEYPSIELMFTVARCLKTESNYDMLISIAVPYPIHWGVAYARRKKHKIADVWVADCGDPYMGDRTDTFRKMFYFQYVEKWFCRKADVITVPFEGAKTAYYTEFQDKIRVVPQGFQLEELNLTDFKKEIDYPIFAYAGGFIPGKRDPEKFFNYLSKKNKEFKFIIYTSQPNLLLSYKETLGDKLEIHPYIPRKELLNILSQADFLINFDNNTTTQLPSKLIDYSIAGRPVLNIKSKLDEDVIDEFLDGNYSHKMKLMPSEDFDIRLVARKFVGFHN